MLVQDQFDIELNKTAIENCDVQVYSAGYFPTLLFDKTIIKSFKMKRINLGVWSSVPQEETIIEIDGWNTLSTATKNQLKPATNIRFSFGINGYYTTRIDQIVDSVTVDSNDDNKATIKCKYVGFLNWELQSIGYQRLTGAYNYRTYPNNITRFAEHQYVALANGYGLKANGFTILSVNYVQIDLGNCNIAGDFKPKNIFGKIKKYDDLPDKRQIEVKGVVGTTSVTTLYDEDLTPQFNTPINFNLGKQNYVDSFVVKALVNGTWITLSSSTDYGYWKSNLGLEVTVFLNSTTQNATKFHVTIYGYYVTVENSTADKVISDYLHLNTQTSALEQSQIKFRRYYSYNKFYEFDCRIDPRIEPQDCIYVDGIGCLRVEETQLTFNGSFKGHIKARLVKEEDEVLLPIEVTDNWAHSDGTFHFAITNPNPFTVTVHIVYSSGVLTKELAPHAGWDCNKIRYPELGDSASAYADGSLEHDVYCYCVDDAGYFDDSDATMIWEENA